MSDLAMHLLLDPRKGHLRLGGKEGAILISALPRRLVGDFSATPHGAIATLYNPKFFTPLIYRASWTISSVQLNLPPARYESTTSAEVAGILHCSLRYACCTFRNFDESSALLLALS